MNEQCIDCGHEFDIHHLKNGLCSACNNDIKTQEFKKKLKKIENMSQRSKSVNEEIIVELKFKVTINSFSNHDGFKDGQIDKAVCEFKDEIKKELEYRINGEYQQQDFLQSVDYVYYEVDSENGL